MNDETTLDADGIGRRVAAVRKLAGLTQEQLANRASLSLSYVRQVERGWKPASPAFVAATSRALDVSAAELMAQPSEVDTRADYRAHAVIAPLRRELAAYRLAPDEDEPLRSLAELTVQVEHLSTMRHAADLTELGAQLPLTLAELRTAIHSFEGSDRERAFALLAETYYAADQVASKLGFPDLATVAVDRYEWAAERSGDELAVLVGDYRRAGELIGVADWSGAQRMLQSSRDSIERLVNRGDDAPTVSVWGNLHLKSGLAAARAGDSTTADAHLTEASEAARLLGEDRDDYRLLFGPTNVDIWRVGLAVEAGNGTEAVARASTITLPEDTPAERAGHHWMDTARGFLLHGDRERSLQSLMTARQVSPEQTRHHPQVHETLRVLAESDRRRTDSLAGFARWAGVVV